MTSFRLVGAGLALSALTPILVYGSQVPLPIQTRETQYAVTISGTGEVLQGELEGLRIEQYDAQGRLVRWEERGQDGEHDLTWIGVYYGEDRIPRRAAYWTEDDAVPFPELMVHAPDGRMQDVFYASPGEKPRRQMREYLDPAGRVVYQEYFASMSQRKYSEEVYRYDDDGNEVYRLWRRLNGKAQRERVFEILATDEHGSWTRRQVTIDGEPSRIDERSIVYGPVLVDRPPASAGPVEAVDTILPVPFAPGTVSTDGAGENVLTFSPDGRRVLFTRFEDDWTVQQGLISEWRDGAWREPEPVPFTERIYNAAFSEDATRIIYCQRDDSLPNGRVFVVEATEDGWSEPIDLTETHGFTAEYFCWLTDGTLYFHREGDIYRCTLAKDGPRDEARLGAPINTPEGVEFGAWVDADRERMFFNRYVEGNDERTGLFVARRTSQGWGNPRKLPLPYGWSPLLTPDGEDLVYVLDDDIVRVPVVLLDLP